MEKTGFLLFLMLLALNSLAQQTNYTDQLEAYMQAQVDVNRFNGNVLVAKNGQILYQKAFGYANYDTKTPLTLNSLFELASVSKQFTAMSILLLKEKGKLSLSDSLRKFFPELPYLGITIRHLLTHTSGLPDYEEAMAAKWNPKKVAFNADLIRFLAQEKPATLFRPGQKWVYSNTGYALLASIVEKVSGQPFAQFTAQRIFKPLGMNRSRIYNTRRSSTEVIPDYAYGYVYSDSLSRHVLPDSVASFRFVYYLDGIQGDGTVNSTVGDLLKWDRALKNHTLLSEAMQREMLSGQTLIDSVRQRYYGYGVGIDRNDRGDAVSHGGGWPGYATILVRYVADDVTVVVLSNNQSNATSISRALADILFDKPVMLPKKRTAVQVPEKLLATYAGDYELAPNFILTITNESGGLMSQATGQGKSALLAETETKFFPKAFEAQLEFVKDDLGKVTKLILLQGGRKTEAKKIK